MDKLFKESEQQKEIIKQLQEQLNKETQEVSELEETKSQTTYKQPIDGSQSSHFFVKFFLFYYFLKEIL